MSIRPCGEIGDTRGVDLNSFQEIIMNGEVKMAHEVEMIDGVAQMAYAGDKPWHGLGVEVSNDLTPAQMQKKAGLDWEVRKTIFCLVYMAIKNNWFIDINHFLNFFI